MSKNNLVRVCVLVSLTVGCGSSGSTDPGNDPGNRSPGDGRGDDRGDDGTDDRADGPPASYAKLAEATKLIYDAVEAGEDVAPYIEGVFEAFGVPVLASSDDIPGAEARLKAGYPFVTSQMVVRMAEAYTDRILVGVESFGESLAEQKIEIAYPFNLGGQSLPEYLGLLMYGTGVQAEAQPDVPMPPQNVLPTLVWALGQERAGRDDRAAPEAMDPIWGDGRLDPLQFALLSFTIFSKPAAEAASSGKSTHAFDMSQRAVSKKLKATPGTGVKQVLKELRGELASSLQDVIGLPLDVPDAALVSVCASLILYGHKAVLSNTPAELWRAPLAPNVTNVELTLTFEDDYENYHETEALRELIDSLNESLGVLGVPWFNCPIPQKGPAQGKSVRWDVATQLEPHGNYDLAQSTTDAFGKASIDWRTIHDEQPQACQVLMRQREEVGWTGVTLHGLVPGWGALESSVAFLKGSMGHAPLHVRYYKRLSSDDTCHRE